MNVLAIDTSTEILALAVTHSDAWASIALRKGLQHSPALLPLAERLLGELGMKVSDLHLLVCTVGPGSFTGIRIGLATALGISHGAGIPVVGVSTLDAIARPWEAHDGEVFAVIDARKGKIYTARYEAGMRRGAYEDLSPLEMAGRVRQARRPLLAGPDAGKIRSLLGSAAGGAAIAEMLDPFALLRIGEEKYKKEGADPSSLTPLYLRKSEAEIASGL
jgi:tRNA threonylcarbamoyladenosine biosynthesis protein TsaB